MPKKRFLLTIRCSKQTVFTVNEIALMFPELNNTNLSRKLSYYVETGGLVRPRRGIYALKSTGDKENYNMWELANKLYSPSYVSLFTILQKEGLIFQHNTAISMVSYTNKKITVNERKLLYHKFKKSILLNDTGLKEENGVWVATKERAFLDLIYLLGDFYIDNLKPLDWEKVFEIQKIYQTKALEKRIQSYYEFYKKEHLEI